MLLTLALSVANEEDKRDNNAILFGATLLNSSVIHNTTFLSVYHEPYYCGYCYLHSYGKRKDQKTKKKTQILIFFFF